MFSVIIPAHNESAVIERCLSSLLKGLDNSGVDVIVVCNGCIDDTAARAARFAGVRVVEIDRASKISALNAGDSVRRHPVVAYVDADIVITGAHLRATVEKMLASGAQVAAPAVHIDLSRSNILVRSFYRVWTRLPYFSDRRMVGSGVYVLSAPGRRRFDAFPNVIADDGFVRSLFDPHERLTVTECRFEIFAPGTLRELIRIKTRARFGNAQLRLVYPGIRIGGENKPAAFLQLMVRQPWLIPAGALYIYAQWRTSRACKSRLALQDYTSWERDESSRTG